MEQCKNCQPITESLVRGVEPTEAHLRVLRFISQYQENNKWPTPCFDRLCLPMLQLLSKLEPNDGLL